MENKRKSKALIITIIILVLLGVVGYFVYKNVKSPSTGNFMSKIFSSLNPSTNTKKNTVQAGEDIKKGDSVSKIGSTNDGKTVVVKSKTGDIVIGTANEDIDNGGFGEINMNESGINNFFNSFSGFMNNLFGGNTGNGGFGGGDIGGGFGGGDIGGGFGGGDIGGGFGDINYACSDKKDNDTDGFIDIDDPECHLDGDLNKEYLPNHDSESSTGTGNTGDKTPVDLVAGYIYPKSTTTETLTTISSNISNKGQTRTDSTFYVLFTIINTETIDNPEVQNNNIISKSKFKIFISKIINKIPWVSSNKTIAEDKVEMTTNIGPLEGNSINVASIFYTFNKAGNYSIRACADKNTVSDAGVVSESDETNNCGPWTNLTVSESIPTGGEIGGDDITTEGEITGEGNDFIDGEKNKCLLVEQNPLTFTDEEKAELEVLLRKFYLISSSLRTADDVLTIYDQIEQNKIFIAQVKDLTKQCYKQVDPLMYSGFGWVRHGNPWYSKTKGGTFPYDASSYIADRNGNKTYFGYTNYNMLKGNEDGKYVNGKGPGCKVVTGYYYGTYIKDNGIEFDCDSLNTGFQYDCSNMITRMTSANTEHPNNEYLKEGCKWKEGVYMEDVERILNIW